MSSEGKEYDDLTVISGISDKRQQWLRESLDVHTFQDLSALSAHKIEAQLKADQIKLGVITRKDIEGWIVEARKKAIVQANEDESSPGPEELGTPEIGGEANTPPAGEGEWEWCGAFLVEFRERRVEGQVKEREITVEQRKIDRRGIWLEDDKDKNSIVIEGEQLYPWMLEQLGETIWQAPEEERPAQAPPTEVSLVEHLPVENQPPEASPSEPLPMAVKVTQIRAFQPPDTEAPIGVGEPRRPFDGLLNKDKPFALEVDFELIEPDAAAIAGGQIPYTASFYAHKIAGASISLGDTEPDTLVTGKTSYAVVLPKAALPPGTYRLGVVVELRGRPPIINHLEVPMVQVI
jgi:hypothetical protein